MSEETVAKKQVSIKKKALSKSICPSCHNGIEVDQVLNIKGVRLEQTSLLSDMAKMDKYFNKFSSQLNTKSMSFESKQLFLPGGYIIGAKTTQQNYFKSVHFLNGPFTDTRETAEENDANRVKKISKCPILLRFKNRMGVLDSDLPKDRHIVANMIMQMLLRSTTVMLASVINKWKPEELWDAVVDVLKTNSLTKKDLSAIYTEGYFDNGFKLGDEELSIVSVNRRPNTTPFAGLSKHLGHVYMLNGNKTAMDWITIMELGGVKIDKNSDTSKISSSFDVKKRDVTNTRHRGYWNKEKQTHAGSFFSSVLNRQYYNTLGSICFDPYSNMVSNFGEIISKVYYTGILSETKTEDFGMLWPDGSKVKNGIMIKLGLADRYTLKKADSSTLEVGTWKEILKYIDERFYAFDVDNLFYYKDYAAAMNQASNVVHVNDLEPTSHTLSDIEVCQKASKGIKQDTPYLVTAPSFKFKGYEVIEVDYRNERA